MSRTPITKVPAGLTKGLARFLEGMRQHIAQIQVAAAKTTSGALRQLILEVRRDLSSVDSSQASTLASHGVRLTDTEAATGDNATAIGTNATDIGTNATDIGTNATDIGNNATAISVIPKATVKSKVLGVTVGAPVLDFGDTVDSVIEVPVLNALNGSEIALFLRAQWTGVSGALLSCKVEYAARKISDGQWYYSAGGPTASVDMTQTWFAVTDVGQDVGQNVLIQVIDSTLYDRYAFKMVFTLDAGAIADMTLDKASLVGVTGLE